MCFNDFYSRESNGYCKEIHVGFELKEYIYNILLDEMFTRSKLYRRKIVAKCAQYGVLEPTAMWCLIYWTRVPAAECSHLLIQHLLNWRHPKRSSWLLLKTWRALQLYPSRQAYTCCFHKLCNNTSGSRTIVCKHTRRMQSAAEAEPIIFCVYIKRK